jgi:site-specific DNA-methyltransferase (adenine-specific)
MLLAAEKRSNIDLRLGRWEDALADVREVDAVITDAPYSARTHAGHDDGVDGAAVGYNAKSGKHRPGAGARRELSYSAWSAQDVGAFVGHWVARTRGWFVTITDHVLAPAWADALEARGRYVFSPPAYVASGSRVRMLGDGPAQWSCWIVVARPRTKEFASWGALPGAYVLPPGEGGAMPVVGGKPLWLMRTLVRDYTRRGDLIVDPCAGAATTLIAAATEGRRAVGAEVDPATHAIADARIRAGYTPTLDLGGA